ncbi:YTH domain-containing family protein [Condylostylus longicornis]|uniref:YTH domain-containing family protein n=1 Tax=Condylostylus longicornis TaxID=2530218 RepID=UPI00244E146D|nr:YTH domain-containing family protein [Condylostylus longicornis]XP_055381837.1 YTH domain-containing family protein [Condylostylus longicornis]XP_055381839.1 YTH domain-containing family protein [Condylostylus longicornis]
MSAGLSEQRLKGQANQGKNVEERSIPWSQQVDEAFFDVSSPNEANLQGTVAAGTQFQYPPFNSKETHSAIENCQGENTRRNSQQAEANQSSLNFYPRKYENDNSVSSKHHISGNHNFNKRTSNHDDTYRSVKNNVAHRTNIDTSKVTIQRGLQTLSLDNVDKTNKNNTRTSENQSNNSKNNKVNASEHQITIAAKQMTWASIASQPAKPTLRSNLASSALKKKGPGMPPPPMVPGKHNMDINTWDTPKNGPTLVPPPLPPVIPVPILEQSIFNQNKVNSTEEKAGSGNNRENEMQKQKSEQENFEPENPNSNNNWTATCQLQNKLPERNNHQHSSTKTISNESNVRPPWVPQYQQQQHHSHHSSQNQSSSYYQTNSRNFNTTHQIRGLDSGNAHYNRHDASASNYQISNSSQVEPHNTSSPTPSNTSSIAMDVHQEHRQNNYNPRELDIKKANLARFFVIKSYSEDDIYRSIKYEIWCSTDHGNRRLDDAFQERQRERGFLYLLFSVNGSGHFCGIAQMMTPVDYNSVSNVWSQKKWKGTFKVKWLYVKDVPNQLFKWITIETNENKPVTNSRDTQEVPNDKGILVMKIIHEYKHTTSLFDDFWHYRKRQEEEKVVKKHEIPTNVSGASGNRSQHRSGGGDFNRGETYDNKNSYHRERRNYNRGGYQNNYENRRGIDNCRNNQDNCTSLTNNNRDNVGDAYRNSGFRNNYRRDDRNDENSLNCVDNRGMQVNFPHRTDNRGLGGSFRERDRDSYKRKGAWRSTQRSVEISEKAEN